MASDNNESDEEIFADNLSDHSGEDLAELYSDSDSGSDVFPLKEGRQLYRCKTVILKTVKWRKRKFWNGLK